MAKFVKMLTVFTALFLLKTSAFAETFTVTSLEDSGAGSLREAVSKAQSGDVISFMTNGTIVLKSTINIDKHLNILAPDEENVIASGGGNVQPFNISGNVTIRNLHIINGKAENGGAIAASGKLILDNCTLTMNSAHEGGALFIAENGWVLLKKCTMVNNFSEVSGSKGLKNLGTIEFEMALNCKPGQKGSIEN
jgi:hypothetical protein